MLAYETLWAIEGIKDDNLKRFFNNYTPSETLKEILNQANLDLYFHMIFPRSNLLNEKK